MLIPHDGVSYTEPFLRCKAEYSNLALVFIAVYLEDCLPHLLKGVCLGQSWMNQAFCNQPVCLPGLAVVGEVGADDAFEVHPQVAVVVLVHEARGGRTADDGSALASDERAGAERFTAGMFEDDVGILACGQFTNPGPQPTPFALVLRGRVLPELVCLRLPVGDEIPPPTRDQAG